MPELNLAQRYWSSPPVIPVAKMSTLTDVWEQKRSLEESGAAMASSWPGSKSSEWPSSPAGSVNIPAATRELMAGSWPRVYVSTPGENCCLPAFSNSEQSQAFLLAAQ